MQERTLTYGIINYGYYILDDDYNDENVVHRNDRTPFSYYEKAKSSVKRVHQGG